MTPRRRLFRKYVIPFVAVVCVALLANGVLEIWFSYRENTETLTEIQHEKALAAAARIETFVREIERQIGWVMTPAAARGAAGIELRRLDFLRLQKQVPAITEVAWLDDTGRERLRVHRLAMDVVGSEEDFSQDPRFTGARQGKTWFGPVTFRKESEPYMTMALGSKQGVTTAEVNLKLIWDVVSQIKVGKRGHAYVVDGRGQLIAHPDISLVLKKTDLSGSAQFKEARAAAAAGEARRTVVAHDPATDRRVLTAFTTIAPLGWTVFVEQPWVDAFAPLWGSILRTGLLILLGVILSVVASLVLARRITKPVEALGASAARIGGGDLAHRIEIQTGDELEMLANEFNTMTARLQESHATLERRVEERTRELSESLEQQTATAEILRVISSSPTDSQPVFRAILVKAPALCDATLAALWLYDGDVLTIAAHQNASPALVEYFAQARLRPSRDSAARLAALERRTVHVRDVLDDPRFPPGQLPLYQQEGARTILAVPMLREATLVGVIVIWRHEPRSFSDKQIHLMETFADQAVIAIENVRLFTELEKRNRDVTEALEQQTATSEILRVISSSPTDVQPVFDAMLDNATRLCDGQYSGVYRFDGELLHLVATRNMPAEAQDFLARRYPRAPEGLFEIAIRDRHLVHSDDIVNDSRMLDREAVQLFARLAGVNAMVVAPMVREGAVIGLIVVTRRGGGFTDKQIALLQTFADQAVIAIENVRLFTELQQRTGELTRSVDELTALGDVARAVGSTLDLETVLTTIVSRAVALSGAAAGTMFEYDEATEEFGLRASHNAARELIEIQRAEPIRLGQGAVGQAAATRAPVQISDIRDAPFYTARPRVREMLIEAGYRSVLAVPLLVEDRILGALVVFRREVGEFSSDAVNLLQTFATQSALAIQNARLFSEIEDKGRQLEVANRHKSEFLANMSHELRTPLNAVIGFSEVLIERMFGEVNEKQDEYLKDIHASGRHLLSLINDILDLSKIEAGRMDLELTQFDLPAAIDNALTLVKGRAAIHAITLAPHVDRRLGAFVADERKLKQILVNILSNAVKFTPEGGRVEVRAAPADGGIEISVTDTGIGIALEDQEAIFEEFRQVGSDYARKREGTGLGLTLTRRFVELHGGRIWVKSAPGQGSTFTFTLPERPWPAS